MFTAACFRRSLPEGGCAISVCASIVLCIFQVFFGGACDEIKLFQFAALSWFHFGRAVGGHCYHWRTRRPVIACGAGRARGSAANVVHQQPEADWLVFALAP